MATSLILTALFLAAGSLQALEMEYVSQEQHSELETLFSKATFSAEKHAQKISEKSWSCDMYGVRSRLQVQRDVTLYSWSKEDAGKTWHNKGAQLLSDYKTEPEALTGSNGRLEDRVKITADGRLVSQLSTTSPQKVVIAYSVCKSL